MEQKIDRKPVGVPGSRPGNIPEALVPFYTNAITSRLPQIPKKLPKENIDIFGNAQIELPGVKYRIKGFSGNLTSNQIKLYCYTLEQFTKQNHYRTPGLVNPIVHFTLAEFLTICGIEPSKNNIDELRKHIIDDYDQLQKITGTLTTGTERMKKNGDGFTGSLIAGKGKVNNNLVIVSIEPVQASLLVKYGVVGQLDPLTYRLDGRNRVAMQMALLLQRHYYMYSNIKGGTADILSVQKILENCTAIPPYEGKIKENGKFLQQILKPFIKTLNYLKKIGIVKSWDWAQAKREPVTAAQMPNPGTKEIPLYKEFIKLYIIFQLRLNPPAIPEKPEAPKPRKGTKKRLTKR